MNKRFWIILAGVVAFFVVLGLGAVAGGALAYMALRNGPANIALAAQVTPNQEAGILVAAVVADSPAAQAGLVRGDIVTQVNGTDVNTLSDLSQVLSNLKSGDSVALTVLHGDETRSLTATLGDNNGTAFLGIIPAEPVRGFGMGNLRKFAQPFIGQSGALITQVTTDSPADKAGLQVGDLIQSVDGQALGPDENLADVIHSQKPGDRLTLTLLRKGQQGTQDVTVTLGEDPQQAGQAYLGIGFVSRFVQQQQNGQTTPFPNFPFERNAPSLPQGVQQAVLVSQVQADSPAEKAGLQSGDWISAIDGQSVGDPQALTQAIRNHKPGDQVTLTVYHPDSSDPVSIQVTLGENPDQAGQAYLGVTLRGVLHMPFRNFPMPPFGPQPTPGQGA